MVRSFLCAILENENFQVTEANTGAAMFEALEGRNFDVIVLDIMLPDGNGVEFARTLRRTSNLPIIFATAVSDTDTRRHAIGLMQVDYVTKPFDAKELLLRIRNILTMAPVMEDPNARDLPKPIPVDATPWYRAPLIWGPALAFLVIVVGGLFLIPGEQDTATLQQELHARQEAEAAGGAATGGGAGTATPQSGVVLSDAEAPGEAGGAIPGATGTAGAAAGTDPNLSPAEIAEQKINEACGELPVSEFWNNNSVKRILRYVRFVHRGDWGEYLQTWVERLKNVQDLQATGKPIELQKKNIVLSGKDLERYVELMERRVRFVRCAGQIIQTTK